MNPEVPEDLDVIFFSGEQLLYEPFEVIDQDAKPQEVGPQKSTISSSPELLDDLNNYFLSSPGYARQILPARKIRKTFCEED